MMERIAREILDEAARHREGEGPFLIAIEGRCASGKTSLAAELKNQCGCVVIPMDDFFLQPFQRTKERLAQPGGNVDRERFAREVLEPLCKGRSFSYRPYDCGTQSLQEARAVAPGEICVVEGVYSCHPELVWAYDLKVFLDVEGEEQMKRLRLRNGKEGAEVFREKWIPLEERYFAAFPIQKECDLRYCTG